MKKFIKYEVLTTKEVVYTFPHWPTKEISGVEFVDVVLFEPSQDRTQQIYHMRKDCLKKIK